MTKVEREIGTLLDKLARRRWKWARWERIDVTFELEDESHYEIHAKDGRVELTMHSSPFSGKKISTEFLDEFRRALGRAHQIAKTLHEPTDPRWDESSFGLRFPIEEMSTPDEEGME